MKLFVFGFALVLTSTITRAEVVDEVDDLWDGNETSSVQASWLDSTEDSDSGSGSFGSSDCDDVVLFFIGSESGSSDSFNATDIQVGDATGEDDDDDVGSSDDGP